MSAGSSASSAAARANPGLPASSLNESEAASLLRSDSGASEFTFSRRLALPSLTMGSHRSAKSPAERPKSRYRTRCNTACPDRCGAGGPDAPSAGRRRGSPHRKVATTRSLAVSRRTSDGSLGRQRRACLPGAQTRRPVAAPSSPRRQPLPFPILPRPAAVAGPSTPSSTRRRRDDERFWTNSAT